MKLGFFSFIILVAVFGLGIGSAYAAGRATNQPLPNPFAQAAASPASGAAAAPAGDATAQAARNPNRPNAPGAGGTAAGNTTGQVQRIEGNTLVVQTAQGTTTTIAITDATRIQKAAQGAISDIKPGERVIVTGQAGADGTVAATGIQIVAGG